MTIVPTISSGSAGPLGVLHLPRLWQKASLDAAGLLHPDYPACGQGYDRMVLEGLGLDREEFLTFIRERRPSYFELEDWVRQNAKKLDRASVQALNGGILGYIHDDATRAAVCESCGIKDDGSIRDAVSLNNMDDWQIFYTEVLKA